MTREHLWAIVALVIATAAGAWWTSTHFERRMVEQATPASSEARRNPWLAAQRFVVEMGGRARTVDHFAVDPTLGQDAVLVMAAGRSAISAEQIETLVLQLKLNKEFGFLKSDIWDNPDRIRREFFYRA